MADITVGEPVRIVGGMPGTNAVFADGHVSFLHIDPALSWEQWVESRLANK
jgi:prepilin-type processing-associated H-X9-DG protein